MPFKKTFRRRRPKIAKRPFKRRAFKKAVIPSAVKAGRAGVHYFKRTLNTYDETGKFSVDGTVLSKGVGNSIFYVSNTAAAGLGLSYGTFVYEMSLNNIPNVTEFSNLFDQYKIHKVVLKIVSYQTSSTVAPSDGTVGGLTGGFFHYAIDHDDVSVPAASEVGVNTLRQYPSYKKRRIVQNRPTVIVIRPKVQTTMLGNLGGDAYGPARRNPWIDMGYLTVPHFGLKGVVEMFNPNDNVSIIPLYIETTYYFSCKGIR